MNASQAMYNCDGCRSSHPIGVECPILNPIATANRIIELERLLAASQEREAEAVMVIGNIEQIRSVEGNSVHILCDNPEADSVETQSAVEVCCDFTGWETVRFFGRDWCESLQKAADRSRSSYAVEDDDA